MITHLKPYGKAIQLINKFEKLDVYLDFSYACESALILVNEIIKEVYESDSPIGVYNYWLDVRCELNTILLGENGRILFCECELTTSDFQLDTGEILCCKCELPKRNKL
jgi:hypothetical protein